MKLKAFLVLITLLLTSPVLASTPPPPEQCFADDWAPSPPVPPPPPVRGLAFVHGTSSHSPYSAHHSYWTDPMIDGVRAGLDDTSKYEVIGCNFTKKLTHADAADCLAEQLLDFIEDEDVTKLVVITHSHGGNMMRFILSNPTRSPSYKKVIDKIDYVIALAPSSLGTPLADKVISGTKLEKWLGTKLGYANDAVEQQQTDVMKTLNDTVLKGTLGRPPLPKNFWTVTGTKATLELPYCGGSSQTWGLWMTRQLIGVGKCSDGFLPCSSQRGAGIPWVDDVDFTNGERELNHNHSRRPCFGLDSFLKNQL